MSDVKNIGGHYYPAPHPGWGGFAEELFHYTSRYYTTAEAFLRSLSGDDAFTMSGYKAAQLSDAQRELMAAILSCEPDATTALAVVAVVQRVGAGDPGVDRELFERYRDRLENLSRHATVEVHPHFDACAGDEAGPLDPFMSLADHLLMPVAVRDRHVEVSLHELAKHLQSPNSTLRSNLHNAVIALHNCGYVLRNHPHLTHGEAQSLSDDGQD